MPLRQATRFAAGLYSGVPNDGHRASRDVAVPAERLREVNRAIEQTAWGGFRTEFYPTYDLKAVAEELHAKGQ